MIQDTAPATIRQDVTRLWEDTKKWIDEVQKRLRLDRAQVRGIPKLHVWPDFIQTDI
jgi:hypothetical protein